MRSPEPYSSPGMAAFGGRWERVQCPEITPLEVGDILLEGIVIRERILEWGYLPALCRTISLLHAGKGATRSSGPLPPGIKEFEALFLAGGGVQQIAWQEALSALPCSIVTGEGASSGIQGGFEILKARGLAGWVLDLGQSQLKLSTGDQFWTFPRDFARLRSKLHVPLSEVPAQRRRLREFIALKLQFALAETQQRPQAIVFALPSSLTEDGTPGTGDYAGMKHDRELLPDALALAGLSDVRLLMLNDAELAAFSARADARLTRFRKILVLTLGFGFGAALICRPDQITLPE